MWGLRIPPSALDYFNIQVQIGVRGDFNGDGLDTKVQDLTFIIDFMFRGSGDPGACPNESDINGDGNTNTILDLTYLIDVIYRGGPAPPGC